MSGDGTNGGIGGARETAANAAGDQRIEVTLLAALGAFLALVAAWFSIWMVTGEPTSESPSTFFPFTQLDFAAAVLALLAAFAYGARRRVRLAMLTCALLVVGLPFTIYLLMVEPNDRGRVFAGLGYFSLLAALPLTSATVLLWLRASTTGRRKGVSRLAISMTVLGGVWPLPRELWLPGFYGYSPLSMFLPHMCVLALCSAAIMRRSHLLGALGTLLAASGLAFTVYDAVLEQEVLTLARILPSLLPIGLLVLGGVLALRGASRE